MIVNVTPDEYICLFESDSVARFDYETETMVNTGQQSGFELLRKTRCQIHQIRVFGSFDIVLREASWLCH